MKQLILAIDGSNIAGDSWRWEFHLQCPGNGVCTLSGRQAVSGHRSRSIGSRAGLRNGIEVYGALVDLMSEAELVLDDDDLPDIAETIAIHDARLADQFRNAPELIEQRDEAARLASQDARDTQLKPFRGTIDRYVLQFSDAPLRFPGGGSYGTRRGWMKRYIEDYVIAHGLLPSGTHTIHVEVSGATYSGGTHEYSGLS